MSIRSINVSQHTMHLYQPYAATSILSRASHLLLTYSALRQPALSSDGRNSLADDISNVVEDEDEVSSHRCSMVKRYHMPTFFTVDHQRHHL